MRVIIINSGRSSIKYEVFDLNGLSSAAKGLLECRGTPDSRLKQRWLSPSGTWAEITEIRPVADHREGFSFILEVSSSARSGSAETEETLRPHLPLKCSVIASRNISARIMPSPAL